MVILAIASIDGACPTVGRPKILVSPQAFAALASTLPLGSVAVEPERAPMAESGSGFRPTCRQSSRRCGVQATPILTQS
jgi:hypothetical protein